MKVWTSILPITTEGQWVLQHRDNLSTIVDPDKISLFGGHLDPGETPLDCVLRETREELGLQLHSGDVEFVRTFDRVDDDITTGRIYFYVVRGVNAEALVLGEGQALVILSPTVDLSEPRFAEVCREMLTAFRAI
jgi:8-oxo-dGTP diphosphatase